MFKYLNLARVLQQTIEHGKQLKTVLYTSTKIQKNSIPAAYSLLSLILNNRQQFADSQERIADKAHLDINNPYLLMVMMAQYINMGKIVGGGKLKRAILDNLESLPQISKNSKINKQTIQIRLRKCDDNHFIIKDKLKEIAESDKTIPELYHLKYQSYSELTKNQEVNILQSTACVMQSFSSCLPPYLLLQNVKEKWGKRQFDIIDACSAPGNKTIQLAEYIGQSGRVFAFEKNVKRFQLLQQTITKYQAENVFPKNQDFLKIVPGKRYRKVKFIMLDPSCSGSGMLTNFHRDSCSQSHTNNNTNQSFEKYCLQQEEQLSQTEKERIQKLHHFQLELLSHAATFQPIRLSYSTCSIYKRQNEDVVAAFLQNNSNYKLKKIKINHEHCHPGFGQSYKNCLRIDPRALQTDGFFVALFSRINPTLTE